jgi:hypothetical protein
VASVKPSAEKDGKISITRDPSGGITARNIQLENLILLTYHVQRHQLKGEPGWVRSERFDVTAKAPAGTPKDQTWMMMRALLEERFRLVLRRETVEMPVYLLVPAKGGLKIWPAERPREAVDGFFTLGRGRIKLRMAPLSSWRSRFRMCSARACWIGAARGRITICSWSGCTSVSSDYPPAGPHHTRALLGSDGLILRL